MGMPTGASVLRRADPPLCFTLIVIISHSDRTPFLRTRTFSKPMILPRKLFRKIFRRVAYSACTETYPRVVMQRRPPAARRPHGRSPPIHYSRAPVHLKLTRFDILPPMRAAAACSLLLRRAQPSAIVDESRSISCSTL